MAETLTARGVLSASLHGNISLRREDGDTILMTGSSLAGISPDDLAVLDLENQVIDGHVAPAELEIIRMHTAVYRSQPDVGCIVHTHSPSATAYAVAGRAMPLVSESLARWGVSAPIPVAKWAPRGSDEAVDYILEAAFAGSTRAPAVLLQSHGVLSWGSHAHEALRRTIGLEENARLAILAESLGGAREFTTEMAESATARRTQFESARPSVATR